MTLNEVAQLFGKSRRTIMRMVDAGQLPEPTDMSPISFDARAVKRAYKKIQDEAKEC